MPSYNDDAGDVIVLNEQGRIMDEVKYTADWHFKLISDAEGVSLERIDFNAASQSAENWHSAATNVGYGTPGYKNSQYRVDMDVKGSITSVRKSSVRITTDLMISLLLTTVSPNRAMYAILLFSMWLDGLSETSSAMPSVVQPATSVGTDWESITINFPLACISSTQKYSTCKEKQRNLKV